MKILVIEDQPAVATALQVLFEIHGLECLVARGPAEALAALDRDAVGVVLQDMNFTPDVTSGQEGIELFRTLRRRHPELPVLLLTAWTSLETAVQLVKEGACDYLAKPWADEKLLATVRQLLQVRLLCDPEVRPGSRAELGRAHDLRGVVYAGERMHALVTLALQVAPSDVPLLITGPSGAGKEKIAEIVQANSRRRERPFVRVNAGALPDELLESELFGAEPGAYTGAVHRRVGRFEAADGGTLFLDEIGNLSPNGQRKLLRVLQGGGFERLGSSETRRVDVRLLCATNSDLRREIAAGRFREDLFYRLNVVELAVPGLAERPEDVLPLADAFLAELARAARRSPPEPERPAGAAAAGAGGAVSRAPRGLPDPAGWQLSPAARERLLRHLWPGNVRELHNTLRRATLLARHDVIEAEDLGLSPAIFSGVGGGPPPPVDEPALAERIKLERALDAAGGVIARAAEGLGLSRQAFYRKMQKHGVAIERKLRDHGPGGTVS